MRPGTAQFTLYPSLPCALSVRYPRLDNSEVSFEAAVQGPLICQVMQGNGRAQVLYVAKVYLHIIPVNIDAGRSPGDGYLGASTTSAAIAYPTKVRINPFSVSAL